MAFSIPKVTKVPESSWFDLSHRVATTLGFGTIVPVDWRVLEAGDIYKGTVNGFCRALSLKAPIMQDIDLKYGTFFVPLRLLCSKTDEILAGSFNKNASDSVTLSRSLSPATLPPSTVSFGDTLFPYFTLDSSYVDGLRLPSTSEYRSFWDSTRKYFSPGSLMDYLGFPCTNFPVVSADASSSTSGSIDLSLLPLKAYHSICNTFFVPKSSSLDCGPNCSNFVDIRPSETGCSFSLSSYSSISGNTEYPKFTSLAKLRHSYFESDPFVKSLPSSSASFIRNSSTTRLVQDSSSKNATFSLDANTIRSMFALDEYARKIKQFYGDFRKQIQLMFGVLTSDKSCMTPILVDSGSTPIQVSELSDVQIDPLTKSSDAFNGTAVQAGRMLSSFGNNFNEFRTEEPGIMMTMAWIRPKTCYINALPHDFRLIKNTDMVNPLFAELGEVAIDSVDVNLDLSDETCTLKSSTPFGYNPGRYWWRKYAFDRVSGDFRTSLKYWHCGREFGDTAPVAGSDFGIMSSDAVKQMNRIFSYMEPDGRPFQLQMRFNTQVRTILPHIDDEM